MANSKWKDLKKFADSLSEEQLNQEVAIEVVEDSVYRNVGFGIVKEDIYMYDDDPEDCGTLQELKDIYDAAFVESSCTLITYKGSVYIEADN